VKTPGKDISIQPPEGTGLAGTEEVAETMLGPTAFPQRKGCSVGLGMFRVYLWLVDLDVGSLFSPDFIIHCLLVLRFFLSKCLRVSV
jgi:hypothetical protein